MKPNPRHKPITSSLKLAHSLAMRDHIWQMNLMSADDFARFCDKRGIRVRRDDIVKLWQLGLLQADLIVRDARPKPEVLQFLSRQPCYRYVGSDSEGRRLYADTRRLFRFPRPWSDGEKKRHVVPHGIKPLFHPFRYYVISQIERLLHLSISFMQGLNRRELYHSILDWSLDAKERWEQSPNLAPQIEHWNRIAVLSIMVEPCEYERVLGTFRRPVEIEERVQRTQIAAHWIEVEAALKRSSFERLQIIWQDLCWNARQLDPNEDVQTLLCLGRDEKRIKLEGRLGGALVLRTMAEMLRRSIEQARNVRLPEEDERGATAISPNVKSRIYGDSRLLDGNWEAADEFARRFGLRYGHHLRWYVEGDTEYHSLNLILKGLGAADVSLINLRGHVAEKAKKGVAFRDSLRSDIAARRFSFVSIDGDRSDYSVALRKAATDDEICGAFFISKPNFECANFTQEELEEIVWAILRSSGATDHDYERYQSAIAGWDHTSGKVDDLLRRAERAFGMGSVPPKGEKWARFLVNFMDEHPVRKDGRRRPIWDAVTFAIRTTIANYQISRHDFRIDPNTGDTVPR